jgi:hypothetical protein
MELEINTLSGLGGRFAYNINHHLAIDAEASFFPETHLLNEEFGQKMQGFVGLEGWHSQTSCRSFRKGPTWCDCGSASFPHAATAVLRTLGRYAACLMRKTSRWTLVVCLSFTRSTV